MLTRRIKYLIGILILSSMLIVNLLIAQGVQVPFVGVTNNQFIIDKANLLTKTGQQHINQIALQLWKKQKIPLMIVTLPTLGVYGTQGFDVPKYAAKLFNDWEFGGEKQHFGILLLVAKQEQQAFIQFGRGWEHQYDVERQKILQQNMIPFFQRGDDNQAIVNGVMGIQQMLTEDDSFQTVRPLWFWFAIVTIFIFAVGLLSALIIQGRNSITWKILRQISLLFATVLRSATLLQQRYYKKGKNYHFAEW